MMSAAQLAALHVVGSVTPSLVAGMSRKATPRPDVGRDPARRAWHTVCEASGYDR
jgi:hypothetical protein